MFSYIFLCKEFLRKNNLESSFSKDTAFLFISVLPLFPLEMDLNKAEQKHFAPCRP